MPRLNEGSLMDRVGLELVSLVSRPYTCYHQNNNAQIIKQHQGVWHNDSIRVHSSKDSRFDTQRPRMYNQTKKLTALS